MLIQRIVQLFYYFKQLFFLYYFLECRHNNNNDNIVVVTTSRENANTALPATDAITIIRRVPMMLCRNQFSNLYCLLSTNLYKRYDS